MKKLGSIPLFVLSLALVSWNNSIAASWTVAKDGSGDYTVIQDALNVCASGDTVRIRPGRYDDFRFHKFSYQYGSSANVIMVPEVAPLTIIGASRDSVFIGPAEMTEVFGGYSTFIMGEDTTAEGRIELFGVTLENAWALALCRASYSFDDCRFGASHLAGLYLQGAKNVTVENCDFDGGPSRSSEGIFGSAAGTEPALLVSNCVFSNLGTALLMEHTVGFELRDLEFKEVAIAIVVRYGAKGTIKNCKLGEYSAQVPRIAIASAARVTMENVRVAPGGSSAISLSDPETYLMGSHLTLAGGSYATLRTQMGASLILRDCVILNAGGMSVSDESLLERGGTVDVRQCYWATTDSLQIEDWISDGKDDPDFGTVMFWPVREAPLPAKSESTGGLKALFRH